MRLARKWRRGGDTKGSEEFYLFLKISFGKFEEKNFRYLLFIVSYGLDTYFFLFFNVLKYSPEMCFIHSMHCLCAFYINDITRLCILKMNYKSLILSSISGFLFSSYVVEDEIVGELEGFTRIRKEKNSNFFQACRNFLDGNRVSFGYRMRSV